MALPSNNNNNPTSSSSPQINNNPTSCSAQTNSPSSPHNQAIRGYYNNPSYPPRPYTIPFRPPPFPFTNNTNTNQLTTPHFNNHNINNSNLNLSNMVMNSGGRILSSFNRPPNNLPSFHFNYNKALPSPPPAHDGNGYRDPRVKNDSFLTVRDRKVKVSGSPSLYAACRSWLRNGFSVETPPHYLDGMNSLPEPSPPPVPDAHSPAEQEPNNEEEDEGSVEHLSSSELLQRHVKRAKKVRARLREERQQRIARYKTRLAFLLPPLVEQHQFRNEAAGRN